MSSSKVEKEKLLAELRQFRRKLTLYKEVTIALQRQTSYHDLAGVLQGEEMTPEEAFGYLSMNIPQEYGALKPVIEKYGGSAEVRLQGGKYSYNAFESSFTPKMFDIDTFSVVIDTAIVAVNMAIGKINRATIFVPLDLLEDNLSTLVKTIGPPNVFIAHGDKTPACEKLEQFLIALDIIPIIAEEQPKGSRSIDQQVDWCLEQCDCAIILATKGDIDSKTRKFIPRGNILIEAGRCQERFPESTIYLLEEGVTFPSNIQEKVRERFSEDNMDMAFIMVVRELVALGILKSLRPQ